MKLCELINPVDLKSELEADSRPERKLSDRSEYQECEISSIHCRAQDVRPGGLFVAIEGLEADGHDYIDEAIVRGAAAIIVQRSVYKNVPVIKVENTRKTLSRVSARFYRNPAQRLCIIGITGTNGKTTTAYLCEGILKKAGFKVGVIGTINYRYGEHTYPNPVTTPESLDLQRILSEMETAAVTHVLLEVSSHAMALYRVADCWLDVGVFTNFSQDHLDFHGDIDSYWGCKQSMFTVHLISGPKKNRASAVINGEDGRGKQLLSKLTVPCLTYGSTPQWNIWSSQTRYDLHGSSGIVHTPAGEFHFNSPLIGRHNVENILAATAVGVALDIPVTTIKTGIESVNVIPGRLERIPNRIERFVFVDYAHTPNALENALKALKSIQRARIICIFGCGGDRDQGKRPLMGEVAGRLSDLAIITSDNPRTEPPRRIIQQIREGINHTASRSYTAADLRAGFKEKGYTVEPDRKKAIELGISLSEPGDIVLIAGKGHETYQVIGKESYPFDDRKVTEHILLALGETSEASITMADSA
ncbi:MAG: UDP-N-acetylmuramoyl-L-alanyl-D-glutamate--2,6-diaminopimelate ligase [Deltaproteobacteria bacterium]|nr:UDP-N-acetylmuramoyl-L-alanyl-D-glutamate--2,6-diaminopimelate ligase [Deltaproteobacteria bacterium]MBW1961946.1 UDP-N-acetylmuramoyl-L-alanyl-D-glutamate--2,6-diaminopimelate ligase [Deltaproteobacteria bacterium]MBW1992898.1 UDP-N-acetylmuramoyl-L-alanyl-D-glutamate--2,6-diaminopimelate ligase [Deltaproteobacteria bacterium]MBW2151880.1 UDP-N-acetylmuramoyl-L-alanyl-D-glutamate--2,6-diaminopimelate ligase [Deltaproteobacteria bacterium]